MFHILSFHVTSRRLCWCIEQEREKSFGNLILLLCKTWTTFCHCFVHQRGLLITWVNTKNCLLGNFAFFLCFFGNWMLTRFRDTSMLLGDAPKGVVRLHIRIFPLKTNKQVEKDEASRTVSLVQQLRTRKLSVLCPYAQAHTVWNTTWL